MKIKNVITFVAITAIALTSCNKDNDGSGTPEGDNYSLFMKFEGLDGTKAETSPVATNTNATFTSGRMYFTKQNGDIVRTVEISNTPGAVTPAQLEAGKLFEDVDKDVYEVYVFGNHNFGTTNYANISAVKALEVTYASQSIATYGVENANLYGSGLVEPAGTVAAAAGADKQAIFEVAPLLARLEIDQIIGATNIQAFTVEDIFIHNFYEKMAVTGALAASPNDAPWRVTTLQGWDLYAPTDATPTPGEYAPAYAKYLYDYKTQIAGTGATPTIIATPAGTNVWAYNVLANAGAEPHIVIKLTGVELNTGNTLGNGGIPNLYENTKTGVDGEAYLTITGYNNGGGRTSILGGNIYKMQTLTFTDENLGETPYPDDDLLKLWVQVEVKKWTVVPVTPIFNN